MSQQQVVETRQDKLQQARTVAGRLGRALGRVSADDVYSALENQGISTSLLGPAAGSIFRTQGWKFAGQWIASVRSSNHARMIRVWQYVG